MYLTNSFGEFINVNKVIMVTVSTLGEIRLYTKSDSVLFQYDDEAKYKKAWHVITREIVREKSFIAIGANNPKYCLVDIHALECIVPSGLGVLLKFDGLSYEYVLDSEQAQQEVLDKLRTTLTDELEFCRQL